jgi:hypothetical protein
MRWMTWRATSVRPYVEGRGGGHVHVPYRSSHLTRVLMECFVRPDAQLGVIGTVSPAGGEIQNKHSTDVEHPPPHPRVCMNICPEGKSCGHVRSGFECLFSVTLLAGIGGHGTQRQHAQGGAVQVDSIKTRVESAPAFRP